MLIHQFRSEPTDHAQRGVQFMRYCCGKMVQFADSGFELRDAILGRSLSNAYACMDATARAS